MSLPVVINEIKSFSSRGKSITQLLEGIGESIGKNGIPADMTIPDYLKELKAGANLTMNEIEAVIDSALNNLSDTASNASELGELKYMIGSEGYEHIACQGKVTENSLNLLELEFNLPGNSLLPRSTDPMLRIDEVKRIKSLTDNIIKSCENKAYKKIVREAFNDYIECLKRPLCTEHGEPVLKRMHQYFPPGLLEKLSSKFELEKLGAHYSRIQLPGKIKGQDILVKIDLDHIFLTNIEIDCVRGRMRMSGFHHDYLGAVEKSGILEMKISENLANGVYKVELGYGLGYKPTSTMFPQNWTRETVMQKSLEALRNVKVEEIAKTNPNRYLVKGVTSEGIDILWVFELQNDKLTGKIISIYPVI